MKILLLGNTGQLGWELQRCLPPLGDVHGLDYPQIDLANPETLREVIRAYKPDTIVNSTAYTAVDVAESKSERCGDPPLVVAASQRGARLSSATAIGI